MTDVIDRVLLTEVARDAWMAAVPGFIHQMEAMGFDGDVPDEQAELLPDGKTLLLFVQVTPTLRCQLEIPEGHWAFRSLGTVSAN